MFRRSIWASGILSPEVNLAEDAILLRQATARVRRLLKIENQGSFVYMRHSTNVWKFDAGSFMDPAGWRPSGAPNGFTHDRLDAYAAAASLLSG